MNNKNVNLSAYTASIANDFNHTPPYYCTSYNNCGISVNN